MLFFFQAVIIQYFFLANSHPCCCKIISYPYTVENECQVIFPTHLFLAVFHLFPSLLSVHLFLRCFVFKLENEYYPLVPYRTLTPFLFYIPTFSSVISSAHLLTHPSTHPSIREKPPDPSPEAVTLPCCYVRATPPHVLLVSPSQAKHICIQQDK